jgi:hypothetical protein
MIRVPLADAWIVTVLVTVRLCNHLLRVNILPRVSSAMSAIAQIPGLIRALIATVQIRIIPVTIERAKQRVVTATLQTGKTLFPIRTRHSTHLSAPVATPVISVEKGITLVVVTVLFSKTEIAADQAVIVLTAMAFSAEIML